MDMIFLMKHEMLLALMLVVLLISKISGSAINNTGWIKLFNSMMVINCIAGWFFNQTGMLFSNMFFNSNIIAFEKNILNTGTLIICLSSTGWMQRQRHLAEFYILMISSLMGMFLMIS